MGENPSKPEGQQLENLFVTAEFAQMHLLILGLYAFGIKSKVPYGAFGEWLHANAPTLARPSGRGWKPSAALNSYMQLTSSVLEAMGIALTEWFPALDSGKRKAGIVKSALPWEPHQLLLFPIEQLDPSQRILREKIHDVIAGKSKRALVAKFVTFKEEEGDKIIPTTGAGTYHATKADGTPRAKKRTYAEKQADEALAASAALKVTLQTWITESALRKLELLPAAVRHELRGLAKDLHTALVSLS